MKYFQWIGLLLAVISFVPASGSAYAADDRISYIGSTESKKYHLPSCEWVKKIDLENRVDFFSIEEAESAGFTECLVCAPKESRTKQAQKQIVPTSDRLKSRKASSGIIVRDSIPDAADASPP